MNVIVLSCLFITSPTPLNVRTKEKNKNSYLIRVPINNPRENGGDRFETVTVRSLYLFYT